MCAAGVSCFCASFPEFPAFSEFEVNFVGRCARGRAYMFLCLFLWGHEHILFCARAYKKVMIKRFLKIFKFLKIVLKYFIF